MMTKIEILTLLIVSTFWSHTNAQKCDLSLREPNVPFPDLWKYTELSYELSVEYALPNEGQYDYAKEYYDKSETTGRVEYYRNGTKIINFYNQKANESFNIVGKGRCESMEAIGTPAYLKDLMTDWLYEATDGQPLVMGPSAMLLHAQSAFKNDPKNERTGYMGKTEMPIRGINAQYWRRCSKDLMFDYYFSKDDTMNAYDLDIMRTVPLRVEIFKEGRKADDKFPQNYDIITFQPYITDRSKLEVPVGVGCKLGEDADIPEMPDFADKNLMIFGEAIYKDLSINGVYDYMSTFMFAMSVNTNHLAYYYSPWDKAKRSKKTQVAGYKRMVYDMKNKYLYTHDVFNDKCTVSREPSFEPSYVLPDGSGYIDLTDSTVLFPNNEFEYVSEGIDREMSVHIFEADYAEGYLIGNATVPRAVITRKYLTDNVEEENSVGIKNALTSINMDFYNAAGDIQNTLTFNFFGFTTKLEHEEQVFDVSQCFKKSVDTLWVTMGFSADPATMLKIEKVLPSVEIDFRRAVERITEINPMRMPTVLVDFNDMLYISFVILDKPGVKFDYLEPEADTTIESDTTEGEMSFDGCALHCLETVDNCWGFSISGTTCYFGTGDDEVKSKPGWKLFRRYNNGSFVSSKENIKNNLFRLVSVTDLARPRFKLSIRTEGDEKPIDLEASYIDASSPGESDELFGLVGMETNPRLRVVKVGAKLDPKAGETIKNFGKIRYDECQRLCLDYKTCETVSFCFNGPCILSLTYGEEIPKTQILEDSFCNLLTRTYTDQFKKSPGLVLSKTAKKAINTKSDEECAKACVQEKSFECRSFDNCPASANKDTCRLHAIHYLDLGDTEKSVGKELTCGHYSRKFNYDFRRESSKRVTNAVPIAATNITLEQCAKLCAEYADGICYGYDYCEDKTLTSSTCTLLDMTPTDMKTIYSPICNHFLQLNAAAPAAYTKSTAAWVGILCFVIAAIVGVGLTFGIGYWRANRGR